MLLREEFYWGTNREPAVLKPEDETLISMGMSNLLQLKRPRLTWAEEEMNTEASASSNSKRVKREMNNMEWEVDETLVEERSYMAEEADLTTPPTSS